MQIFVPALSGLLILPWLLGNTPQGDDPRRESGPELGALPPHEATTNHAALPALQRDFATGPEVTATCLTCHTEAAKQIMKTSHWTWICPRAKAELAAKQDRVVGKGEHVINNFCIALGSNEPRCTSCHAGHG